MTDIVLAVDETAATTLVQRGAAKYLEIAPRSGAGSLGPFGVNWAARAGIAINAVQLNPPNQVRLVDGVLSYRIHLDLVADLNRILPRLCLPQVCIPTPFGDICSPEVCVNWPTISIPVNFSDTPVTFNAAFQLRVQDEGANWAVMIVSPQVDVQLSPLTSLLLLAIGAAAGAVLTGVPFIGPFLALAVELIIAAIAVTGAFGLLGIILNPFLEGLLITVYRHPKRLLVLPAELPLNPEVDVILKQLEATVDAKKNLTLSVSLLPG